jgi:miniconductance mechanosensitive channel
MNTFLQSIFTPLYERIGLSVGLRYAADHIIAAVALIVIILGIGKISGIVFQKLLPCIFSKNTGNSGLRGDVLTRSGLSRRAARIVPAVIVYLAIPLVLPGGGWPTVAVKRLTLAFLALTSAHISAAFLDAVLLIHQASADEQAKRTPVKSYLQLVKIFLYIIGAILAVTALANVSPLGILSGVGAMSAVLMLVFKDLIIGFVSSMQLSSNDMVRIGDIIDMPKYGADGSVIDITLQSVVVRNWDLSISTIPIYSLISDSFHNWRCLAESPGRRVKRSLYIDARSVRFLTQAEIEKLSAIPLLSAYMRDKLAEIGTHNGKNNVSGGNITAERRLTNLGTFRAYTELYLKSLPIIAPDMPFVVRLLQSEAIGIPLELYFFCSEKVWINYEHIQSDIFDHLLAIITEFGLGICCLPAGCRWGEVALK